MVGALWEWRSFENQFISCEPFILNENKHGKLLFEPSRQGLKILIALF